MRGDAMVFSGVSQPALAVIIAAVVVMTVVGVVTLRCPLPWSCVRSKRGNAKGYTKPQYPNMIHEHTPYPHPIVQMMAQAKPNTDETLIQF
jgi:hypothetical protein